jgi:hypothetical protein
MKRLVSFWWIALLLGLFSAVLSLGPIVDLQITEAFQDIRRARFAVENFRAAHGSIPSKEQGLESLVSGGHMVYLPTDPWGNALVYSPQTDGSYTIYSVGIDGRDNYGAGDDVTTSEKKYGCEDYGLNCLRPGIVVSNISLCVAFISLLVGIARGAIHVWKRRGWRRA